MTIKCDEESWAALPDPETSTDSETEKASPIVVNHVDHIEVAGPLYTFSFQNGADHIRVHHYSEQVGSERRFCRIAERQKGLPLLQYNMSLGPEDRKKLCRD
jgi:hypothetical protein